MAEERRLVTILFADVAGSTELGESLDPEDTRALLSRFYAIAKDIVGSHGGTIEKFIGDAVMAVFGMPAAHGDDAERAISAALEIRDRVRGDPKLGDRLPVRLGVNTGEVVATRDGSAGDFLITGDAVNVAARLQQAAEPWSVLCGERTARAAAHAFAFSTLANVAAKGKRAGVLAAPVIGRAAVHRARVPLVGRDADLAQLKLLARRAFTERRPQLVSIIAPAGIGKTRLLEEFLDDLPGISPEATVAIAQCLPYGQRLTYWPLRAVLFRLATIPEDAQPAAIRDGIRRWLAASELEDREEVAELLAATVGAGETEVSDRAALFAAWRSAIEFASKRSALVVAFEDLHWSSESVLDLVEFVMQPRGELPVLMVALTRPELLDRRPSWGGGKRNYVALSLEPLRDDAVGELVRHLLEASSPEIVSRVVARAEGNPFYAGELVRALLDRVSSLADAVSVERALATLPDTVQATVLARLDLLRPEERRVLQLGAVLGRSFRIRGIRALAPELGDVTGAVDALVEKDLVRAANADTFTFRHILIREVAYQTLPRAERARLHAGAARWLEEFAAGREDAFAELIAYHYREAATLAPADEPDALAPVRRGALAWLGRAAEVALTGAANVEAVRHLRAAVDLADREDLPELHERIGEAHTSGEAADAYGVALRLGRELGRPVDQQLRCLAGMLTVYMRSQGSIATRPSDEALNALRAEARALLPRATDARTIARFHIADSFYPFWSSGLPAEAVLDTAEASARAGLAIAERLGDRRLQSAALDGIGSILSLRGDFAGSRALARRRTTMNGLDLVERMDAFSVATWMSVLLGDLDDAMRVSADGLAHVQPGQAPAWALHLVAWRTLALALRGQWDEALAHGHRARLLWIEADRLSAGYAQRGFLTAFGIAKARRNAQLADLFREVIQEIALAFGSANFGGRGRLAIVRGDLDDLERSLREWHYQLGPEGIAHAFAILSDAGRPPSGRLLELGSAGRLRPLAPLLRGEVHRANGLAARDGHELGLALEIFERCGATPSVARVRCEHGLIAADSAELEAGLRMLGELGDVEQMERYERWAKRA